MVKLRPWQQHIVVDRDLKCDLCGKYEGQKYQQFYGESYITILKAHYEEHLSTPREIDICTCCHTGIHGFLHRKKVNKEGRL